MFKRAISTKEVEYTLRNGEIIQEYPADKPYPSKIIFAYCNKRPLHLVYSYNIEEDTYIIITTYEPRPELWKDDFKTRRNQ